MSHTSRGRRWRRRSLACCRLAVRGRSAGCTQCCFCQWLQAGKRVTQYGDGHGRACRISATAMRGMQQAARLAVQGTAMAHSAASRHKQAHKHPALLAHQQNLPSPAPL